MTFVSPAKARLRLALSVASLAPNPLATGCAAAPAGNHAPSKSVDTLVFDQCRVLYSLNSNSSVLLRDSVEPAMSSGSEGSAAGAGTETNEAVAGCLAEEASVAPWYQAPVNLDGCDFGGTDFLKLDNALRKKQAEEGLPVKGVEGASIRNAKLTAATFSGGPGEPEAVVKLAGVDFSGSILALAELERVDLEGATLRKVYAHQAKLAGASLIEAALPGANCMSRGIVIAKIAAS